MAKGGEAGTLTVGARVEGCAVRGRGGAVPRAGQVRCGVRRRGRIGDAVDEEKTQAAPAGEEAR